ncbi:MAG: hypothetical protein IPG50_17650 [Myxococcales bacterium]|nr:hypothetical protein [Myxococcales bacterium]
MLVGGHVVPKARGEVRRLGRGLLVLGACLSLSRVAGAEPSTTTPEQGYDLGETQGSRGLALGGAHYALGTSTSAIYGNPANLPLARVYHIEGMGALSPEARLQSVGGAIADSSTSRLAGGLAANLNMLDPDRLRRSWTDVRLALGFPLADAISVGATGRYLRATQATTRGPFGPSLASDGTKGEPVFSELTFDAGITVAATSGLRIGAVGKNLSAPGTAFAPTTVGGGIGYLGRNFAIEGGGLADFTTFASTTGRVMAGGEYFLLDRIPLRVGYRFDQGTKTHAVSGGVGYVDRRWSVEFAARRDVVADQPMTKLLLALRFFYDSGGAPAGDPEL